MKAIVSAALLYCCLTCSAQEKLLYYDNNRNSVKEKNATILIDRIQQNDSTWEFNTCRVSGPLSVSMRSSNKEGTQLHGRFITYDVDGRRDTAGTYRQGKREGVWQVFAPDGKVRQELIFSNGELSGQKDSVQVRKEFIQSLQEAVSKEKIYAQVDIESEYPGGPASFLRFLAKNMRYPQAGEPQSLQSSVIVGFVVDLQGIVNPIDIFIARSVDFAMDREAIRMVRISGKWVPAILNGSMVRSVKLQRFVCVLPRTE